MSSRPALQRLLCLLLACACASAGWGLDESRADTRRSVTGGAVFVPPPPPPKKAKIRNGRAIAPLGAPRRVRRVIAAANRLVRKPYRYGGGHGTRIGSLDTGYDCSGAVSYALYGGRFLRAPLTSSGLMSWGRPRPGRWITVYASGPHAYVVVAGLRFDTGMRGADAGHPGSGPRWSRTLRRSASFVARHPRGY